MRNLLLVTLLCCCGLAAASELRERYGAAIAAYQAGDAETMLEEAEAALDLRPASATLRYLYSAALSLNGRGDAALRMLAGLARQGLSYRPEAEPAFASLVEREAFQALLERFAENAEPRGQASLFRHFDQGDFIPEGIAYAASGDTLFLGSIRQRRIVALGPDGQPRSLVGPGEHGLLSVFGMKLVKDTLYVATAGLKETGSLPEEELGRTGIFLFDTASGALRQRHWLPEDDSDHLLGDLLLFEDLIYATDSLTGQLWSLDPRTGQWRERVAAGRLVSPQGLTTSPGGAALILADYRTGLYRYLPEEDRLEPLEVPDEISVEGIDGLYRHGGDLIAIQNGIRPHRVVRLELDEGARRLRSLEVLVSNLEGFDEPTLGVVAGDRFLFVGNSHWPRFDADGGLPPAEELDGPQVWSLLLEPEGS